METIFGLLNLATLPWWLSMLLFPRTTTTTRLVTSPWPFIALAGVYATLLLAAFGQGGSSGFGFDAASLLAALSTPAGFLTAWAHMLALDLFAGTWIFRDARYYGRLPRVELLLTWWAGPLGLGIYLWRRRSWAGPSGTRTKLIN